MEINKVDFSYDGKIFMKNVNGAIQRGRVTTILGPNGSGKSTLLNLLVNQLKPQHGTLLLDGENIQKMKVKEIAQKMAIVHQQNLAPSDFTVRRLVSFGRMPYQTMLSSTDAQGEEIVNWALEETRLSHMADKYVGQLSGGERQRAWIAMALAQKTEILFLDEPTTYLDIYYQMEILQLVKHLNKKHGMTIVMVLHDINQAIQFSDDLIIMKEGQIIYEGSVDEGITPKRLKEVYGICARVEWCKENCCPYIIPLLEETA